MTCIVGMEVEGKVLLAGDIQGTGWNNKVVHTQPKVFSRNGIIIGYTTSYRLGQIVEQLVQDPVVPANDSEIYRWLITVFVEDIRARVKDIAGKDDGPNCLIGIRGQLWEMQADYSVLRSRKGYMAVGSGYEYALGSMETALIYTPKPNLQQAEEMLRNAVKVAGEFSPSVGHESHIIST